MGGEFWALLSVVYRWRCLHRRRRHPCQLAQRFGAEVAPPRRTGAIIWWEGVRSQTPGMPPTYMSCSADRLEG